MHILFYSNSRRIGRLNLCTPLRCTRRVVQQNNVRVRVYNIVIARSRRGLSFFFFHLEFRVLMSANAPPHTLYYCNDNH